MWASLGSPRDSDMIIQKRVSYAQQSRVFFNVIMPFSIHK